MLRSSMVTRIVGRRGLTTKPYTEAEQLALKVASYLPRYTSLSLSREDEVVLYVLPEHMDKVALFLRDSAFTQMTQVADASSTAVMPPK